ncbi:flagellar hook-associated protein 2 [mine drainage metagenome]|uniref:Filament cap protein n=1 Tax=mine drainage metagenome TaxID=410659 RepID=A0A1J5QPU7_9ZZZZ
MSVSSTTSTGTGTLSSPGLGSGLDVTSIVSKLMSIEQQPLTLMQNQASGYQSTISAYGKLSSGVSSLEGSVTGLNSASLFQSFTANASNTGVATATAGSTAALGNYSVNVTQLAQAQSLVAAGQASATAPIGTGASTTLTFNFGTIAGTLTPYDSTTGTGGTYGSGTTFTSNGNGAQTVTIDSSNNSLTGIAAAINAAGVGVTASIINDGSGTPYRLTLTSTNTGANNSLSLGVSGDATLASLLGQDPTGTQNLQQTTTGQNAQLTVNGLAVNSPSNTVSSSIAGVSLSLLTTGSTNISVTQNTSAASTAINSFVTAYNNLNSSIQSLTAYNPTTQIAGPLLGDSLTTTIQSQIQAQLGGAITNSGAFRTLSQIGITMNSDGSLSVNSTTLQNALANKPSDVAALFAATGRVTDSLTSFAGSTDKTQPGNYDLNITQLATQGTLVGSSPVASLSIAAGVNDALNVTLNGVNASVTLPAKTYASASELALAVQSAINGATQFVSQGLAVTVNQSGGIFSINTNQYGSAATLAIAGNGAANILGSTPVATAGKDVAGTIGGLLATGSGMTLTGAAGTSVEGMKLTINGGSTGDRGVVNFSTGYATGLNALLSGMLGSKGSIASATNGLNASITDIQNQENEMNQRLTAIQANYMAQFSALDTVISSMQSTSSYLTQQLAALPKA